MLGLQFGLLGVGLTLVYGLGGVLNLAQGQIAVLGAIVVALHDRRRRRRRSSPCSSASPSPAPSGSCLDLTLMRPVYRQRGERRVLLGLLLMLGVAFIIEGLLVWRYPIEALSLRIGGDPIDDPRRADAHRQPARVGDHPRRRRRARRCSSASPRSGKAVRSVIQDEEGAQLCGINPAVDAQRSSSPSAACSPALVAVTRSMTSPVTVTPGIDFTILALIVAVVGGLGSVSGAFLAGVLLGIVNTVSSYYIGSYVTTIVLLAAPPRSRSSCDPSGLLGRPR